MKSKLELNEICNEWLEMKKLSIRDSTYCKYEWIIDSKIKPFFADYDVESIDEKIIRNYMNILLVEKKYKYNFICLIRSTLFSIIRYCEKRYGLNHIDLSDIKIPVSKQEAKILSKNQENKINLYLKDHKNFISMAISLGLHAGLRVGEVCALKWEDVDLENGIIHVNRTVQRIRRENETPKSKLIIGDPKTFTSKRKIVIPHFLVEYLSSYHQTMDDQGCFVITNKRSLIDPDRVEYQFSRVCRTYNFRINFHSLRHTYATNCVQTGIDIKTISEILGHSNVSITLNRYVHTNLEFQKSQISKIKNPFSCEI